jgi:hypothetical protein
MKQGGGRGEEILLRVFRLSPLPEHKLFSVCIIDVLITFLPRLAVSIFRPTRLYKIKKLKRETSLYSLDMVTL